MADFATLYFDALEDREAVRDPAFLVTYNPCLQRLLTNGEIESEDETRLWKLVESRDLKAAWVRLGLSLLTQGDVGDVSSAVDV
jgi:hypothetical protein